MNVFVVGANGQVGRHIVQLLHHHPSHTVRAMVRKEEQATRLIDQGINVVIGDLEDTVTSLMDAMRGCDAVIFAAGSGGSTGSDKTLLIDLDGAVKTMEAAEGMGISRFVMVSAFQAHQRGHWAKQLKPYYVAKHYADEMLIKSNLNYTIVRPGGLTNDPGTGKVEAGRNLTAAMISREDVAGTVVACLDQEQTYRCGFDLIQGLHDIQTALRNVNN